MTMLDAALRYAERGLFVFPLAAGTKVPLRGTHGYKTATRDEAQLREWWSRHPNANLGIATGRSGLVVIDLDRKNGVDGFARLPELEERFGPLPGPTKMASTPNGGGHLYFRTAGELKNGPIVPGVDVCPFQIMAPPSIVDDRPYRWDVCNVSTQELPAEWVEALTAPVVESTPQPRPKKSARRYCLRAMQDEAHALADAPPGIRNQQLHEAAIKLGGLVHLGEIDSEDVATALEWACSKWDRRNPRKDRNTIARGLAFGIEHPRQWEAG